MKKSFLPFIILIAISTQVFSQSKVILPAKAIEEMKKKGQMKKGVEYLYVPDVHPVPTPSPVTKEHLAKMHYKSSTGPVCSCLVPVDPSFSICEFDDSGGNGGPGTPPDYRNDDWSTAAKPLPFSFCLYGTNYSSVYINNNGNVTFGTAFSVYTGDSFPSATIPAMVAPFWGDVDTRDFASGLVYYKITPTYMIVKWENVGYYDMYSDKLNTFQLIISDGVDPILPGGNNIAFCYGDMQWTTGDASGGVGGFGGIASTVGCNKGDGVSYLQLGRFDQAGLAYDGGYGNNDGVSWLDNQSMYFNVCNATNIAPISSGLNNCDTIKICGSGDTLYLNGLFLSPEIGQITNIAVNLNGTPNATVISNTSGNSADAIVMIIATTANAGVNTITFTATDNGIPAATTIVNVNVFVDTTNLTNFNPVISGILEFCEGGSSVLSVAPITYDSYVWNTGFFGTSITVDTSGIYYVTASLNGCYKSTAVTVIEHPNPVPIITGATFTCNGNPTTISLDQPNLYATYTWSNGSTNTSITTSGGTYSITVTDTNGCTGSSPQITVTSLVPTATISTGPIPFCPGDSVGLTANPTPVSGATFIWNNTETTQTIQATSAGTYTVIVNYLANGCADTTSVNVTTYDAPNANFSSNPNGLAGPNILVQFTDLSTVPTGNITSWTWNFGDSALVFHSGQNPTHAYSVNGTYIVTLIVCTANGCCDSIEFPYTIVSDIEIPNVITPHNPGDHNLNQYLYFKNLEYFPGTKLLVYNRWGNKIYENDDYTKFQKESGGWNGAGHSDGVYYFILDGPLFKEPKYGFVQILN